MSAAVHSGSKRSSSRFEEDFPAASTSKKSRRLSRSPGSPPLTPKTAVLTQLSACFPHMDARELRISDSFREALSHNEDASFWMLNGSFLGESTANVLSSYRETLECGNDVDAAVRRLQELCIGSAEQSENSKEDDMSLAEEGMVNINEEIPAASDIPVEGTEWVELLVKEMSSASSYDDARARATRVLEALEQSLCQRAHSEAAQNVEKENMMLKQHIEALVRDNTILKRAVAIQHERQKDIEVVSRELQHMKQLVPSYQEQLKKLELDNYTLSLQLKHAQLSQSVPRNFPPDVY